MIQQAKWIAPLGGEKLTPCHFLAVREIEIDALPSEVKVQIACDSIYLLEINHQVVGRGPARCTRNTVFYDEYDVRKYFRPGKNTVQALVLCMNIDNEACCPITPALRMAVGNLALTDESWKMYLCEKEFPLNPPIYSSQSGFAEYRDLNYDHHLQLPEAVPTVTVPDDSPLVQKKLCHRSIPLPLETVSYPVNLPIAAFVPYYQLNLDSFAREADVEKHLPLPHGYGRELNKILTQGNEVCVLPVPSDNGGITLVFDFAKEVSGRIEIDLEAPAGVIADIAQEEELYYGDRIRADHTHKTFSYQFCDRYILRPGRQTIGNYQLERGFRMIQLTLRQVTGPVKIHSVKAVDVRYPLVTKGQFFCSDYQLNRLWQVSAETISACTTDIFTDCPWRERLFYNNDLVVENCSALKLFGDKALHRRAFYMVFDQTRPDDLYTSVSPSRYDGCSEGQPNFSIILPANLTMALAMRDYLWHTGDLEIVRERFDQLKKIQQQFKSWKNEQGIIVPPIKYWNFFDWSFELNGINLNGKPSSLLNFLYIISSRALNQLAEQIGETALETEESLQEMLQQTVDTFYDPEQKLFINSTESCRPDPEYLAAMSVDPSADYVDSCRLTHAFAILAGADIDMCSALNREDLMSPDMYYSFFMFEAWRQSGQLGPAMAHLRKYWGAMLDTGTPTLWENGVHQIGKAGFGGSASLCHGFSTSPVNWLHEVSLGVRPLESGFARFRFEPIPGELTFARGTVPTPNGSIQAEWKRTGTHLDATLVVPEDCVAVTPVGELGCGAHQLSWDI